MRFERLKQNLLDLLKEQQMKLGYQEETVRLYYPAASLCHLLGQDLSIQDLDRSLQTFKTDMKETFGQMEITHEKERFCFIIPKEGVRYAHTLWDESEFLYGLIQLVGHHGCTMEQVITLFGRYSDQVCVKQVVEGDFDYVIYFQNETPDAYRYCFSVEGEHVIYHRFLKEDYFDFLSE